MGESFSATAPIKVIRGSVSSPGLTVSGDEDTGLYSPAPNQLAVTVGGSDSVKFSSTGLEIDGNIELSGSIINNAENGFTGNLINLKVNEVTKFSVNQDGAITGGLASTSANGLMAAADKTKLDGIATGANNYVHPNHTGDVTSTGDGATVIANDAVSNAKLANMASNTIKARITSGSGDPEDATASQIRSLLNVADGAQVNVPTDLSYTAASRLLESSTGADVTLPLFSSTEAGLVPASGGGTSTFLRADGTFAAPTAGPAGTVTSVGLSVPTGLNVSGSPITSSGTLTISLASGYTIPTTAELAAFLTSATAATTYQPLDSDLTAIAALTTTSFGRGLLALADAAAGRTTLGLENAVVSNTTGITGADVVTNIVSLTQAEYDAITTPSASTLYVITN